MLYTQIFHYFRDILCESEKYSSNNELISEIIGTIEFNTKSQSFDDYLNTINKIEYFGELLFNNNKI